MNALVPPPSLASSLAPPYAAPLQLGRALAATGHAVVSPAGLCALLDTELPTLTTLQPTWDDLPADAYLRDGGRYRRRRHACFIVDGQQVGAPVKLAGMAFQNPTMLPWRTTLDNILLPLEIVQPHRSRLRKHKAEYVGRAESLLAQVGLKGQGDKFPWQLSGGMQQRASLCRALIHEPKLLMLDEPFGALDSFTREELWCVMRDLHAAQKVTIILVTHDLREAAFLADRMFCQSARPGRIVADREVPFPGPGDLELT